MKQNLQYQRVLWAITSGVMVAVLLAACMPIQPVTEVNAQSAAGKAEDVTTAVTALWDEYEASIEAADAERWGDLWVDDGVKYPPDGLLLEGKAAIVNNMREWFQRILLSIVQKSYRHRPTPSSAGRRRHCLPALVSRRRVCQTGAGQRADGYYPVPGYVDMLVGTNVYAENALYQGE